MRARGIHKETKPTNNQLLLKNTPGPTPVTRNMSAKTHGFERFVVDIKQLYSSYSVSSKITIIVQVEAGEIAAPHFGSHVFEIVTMRRGTHS